ncbi:hypothetical protein [Sphingomonas immobilis]|uniref:Uncharacterized protein n=1 Tax=Sphingomonas immobilis TaxID=3063997 RepID=A0ABT8ZUH4_9SPHN|nr:hypothetical protein [Sphingomonas sp. CA1-15]MDO7841230.1 hypothetical protein [Sphingomonas sp. CA1-15]
MYEIEATKRELERVLRVLEGMNDTTSRGFLRDYMRELDAKALRFEMHPEAETLI